ncbi:hypothetical protein SDRG_00682 [Saprolegnia diclina VS20]|uniref:Uncharacterized protein n=1 Tax=Saprolegnia diclina (strain VS20) TaxID=1156394 RepID=T0S928_SAPDV|nr:hypothetical protein SDRG_00682 [Saprolegnia diclina VS20]EQC41823.1 hypothetical protein SDRG_00682 [Saprolegnia diclina VS20]|eukprot:XP_008604392.1 hypothetical protein SDRG_00682 [Saprolegnia diclina VS20]
MRPAYAIVFLALVADGRQPPAADVYAWDPMRSVHVPVVAFSQAAYEVAMANDPRHAKYVQRHTSAAEAAKKPQIKVLERKHKYPTLAVVISMTVLLTSMYIIMQFFS